MKKTITYGEVKDTCLDVINNGGGGSSSEEYSTEEKAVGKWIDGKTIYRKTVVVSITVADNSYGSAVLFNVPNLDRIIKSETVVHQVSGNYWDGCVSDNEGIVRGVSIAYSSNSHNVAVGVWCKNACDSVASTVYYTKG